MSGDIVAFLRARYDEDERIARESTPGPWAPDVAPDGRWYLDPGHGADDVGDVARRADADHIARHDPTRVLAEVDAKRQIVDLCESALRAQSDARSDGAADLADWILEGLAQPYAGHPDYRPEWGP